MALRLHAARGVWRRVTRPGKLGRRPAHLVNVLTVNCGSSSIKIQLCRIDDAGLTKVAGGAVEALGPEARLMFSAPDGAPETRRGAIADHATALRMLLDRFGDDLRRSIEAVGHRVVQGGEFTQTVIIDDAVVRAIEAGRRLAPLHNGPSLEGILAAREELPRVPMVAVFDTTFHLTLPATASHYALPQELALKHGLRRYGYHGIAHRSMAERYAELAGAAVAHRVSSSLFNSAMAARRPRSGTVFPSTRRWASRRSRGW